MKRVLLSIVIALGFLSASAQGKIGYISTEELISVMPEAEKANLELQDYQASLAQQGNDYVNELNEKDSALGVDSFKLSPAAKELRKADIFELYKKVQGWEQTMQEKLVEKRQALLIPIRNKAMETINLVAKENGYAYIFDQSALLVSPPGDDILPLVKKKMGIKDAPPAKAAPTGAPKMR